MLDEIIKKYENFSDGKISNINYHHDNNITSVEIILSCMNSLNEYKYEKIKIVFVDVRLVQFYEIENYTSIIINHALITYNNGIILFDFFPLIYKNNEFRENENSNFKIKCKEIVYNNLLM